VTKSTAIAPLNLFKTIKGNSLILWAAFAVKPTASGASRVLERNIWGGGGGCWVRWSVVACCACNKKKTFTTYHCGLNKQRK